MIPTTLRGGGHRHARIIIKPAKYFLMTGGTAFIAPANPGNYSAGLAVNAGAREEAMHKELIAQIKILARVEQALKDIIIEAVKSGYLLGIEDKTLGFLNQTPRLMLNHLRNRGGTLDFVDNKTLLAERDQEWDAGEVPMLQFNQVEKAMKQLT